MDVRGERLETLKTDSRERLRIDHARQSRRRPAVHRIASRMYSRRLDWQPRRRPFLHSLPLDSRRRPNREESRRHRPLRP
jgi:hypothetical protein